MEKYQEEINDKKPEIIRAVLRERFLRLLSQLSGKKCAINMYENTKVRCSSRAFKPDLEAILVEDLKTPLPEPLKTAILRCHDIISIEYNL